MKKIILTISVVAFAIGAVFFNIQQKQQKFSNIYTEWESLSDAEKAAVPKQDRIDLAMLQNYHQIKDPVTGELPELEKLYAFKRAQQLLRTNSRDAIEDVIWIERGPTNVGGRTRAILFDPQHSGTNGLMSAGVTGGLWQIEALEDHTEIWRQKDDFFSNLAICALCIHPNNENEIYAGTGEGFLGNGTRGFGILKTSNGGVDWTFLPSTENNNFRYVNRIAMTNQGTILAATNSGLQRSTDGGETWTETQNGNMGDVRWNQDGTIYLAQGLRSAGKLYRSVNDGQTWTEITPPGDAARIELGMQSTNSDVLYVIGQERSSNAVGYIQVTRDGGTTWQSLPIPDLAENNAVDFTRSNQAWYDLAVAVHPNDENLVVIGGIDLHRSTDGGSTWQQISHWYGGFGHPEVHADQHNITIAPNDSNLWVFGNDGGVYYTNDITAANPTFNKRVEGYNVTQFYACAMSNVESSDEYLAGSQDNGTHQFTNTGLNATREVTGGDGAFCFIDQDENELQITSFVYNSYYLSKNGGTSFNRFIDDGSKGRFINPADYDSKFNVLYAAGNSNKLMRYNNITTDPTIDPSLSELDLPLNGGQISHIRVSEFEDHTIYVGTGNGDVFKISDLNTSPITTELTAGQNLCSNCNVSCIEEGSSSDQLLLTYSNYNVSSVFETQDGGANWVDKEGDLPNIPVRWALYHPTDKNQVLLATEVGVWSTDNLALANPIWGPTNEQLANVRCDMLQIRASDNVVAVATHGRGLFTTNAFAEAPTAAFDVSANEVCPNEPVTFTNRSTGSQSDWQWFFGEGANPASAVGPGPHTITYTTGGFKTVVLNLNNGQSVETKTNHIEVPINVEFYGDTALCPNESATIGVTGTNVTYNWSNGLGDGDLFEVSPSNSTTYQVTATDNTSGCVQVGSIEVLVANDIPVNVQQNSADQSLSTTLNPDSVEFEWRTCNDQIMQIGGRVFHPPANGKYLLWVNLGNSDCAITSRCIEVNGIKPVSINVIENNAWSVYPNPLQNTLNIQFEQIMDEKLHFTIIDVQGRIVVDWHDNTNYAVDGLQPGLYWLKVQSKSNEGVKLFLKE